MLKFIKKVICFLKYTLLGCCLFFMMYQVLNLIFDFVNPSDRYDPLYGPTFRQSIYFLFIFPVSMITYFISQKSISYIISENLKKFFLLINKFFAITLSLLGVICIFLGPGDASFFIFVCLFFPLVFSFFSRSEKALYQNCYLWNAVIYFGTFAKICTLKSENITKLISQPLQTADLVFYGLLCVVGVIITSAWFLFYKKTIASFEKHIVSKTKYSFWIIFATITTTGANILFYVLKQFILK